MVGSVVPADLTSLEIRNAVVADLPRVFAIYNREVVEGIATFETVAKEVGRDDDWLTGREAIHPVIVGVSGGEVVSWASLGPWSPRGAYRRTAEVSVYVEDAMRGRGIGTALLRALVERAREIEEVRVLLARIALPNPASLRVHEAVGFRSFGTQRRCGEKLGRVLDVELLDLHLD